MRSAAISYVIACAAMVAGPGTLGSAVASADGIFGIGIDASDIFGQPKKGKSRPVGVEAGVTGRAPNLVPVPTGPTARSVVIRAEHHRTSAPATPAAPAPVRGAPSARSVVIRAEQPASMPTAPAPPASVFLPPVVASPVVAPLGPAPAPPPAAPPSPVIQPPRINLEPAPADSLAPQAIPESIRSGYPNYLREADFRALLAAALPGVAGLLVFTASGVMLGYRQARAGQAALVRTDIARLLR